MPSTIEILTIALAGGLGAVLRLVLSRWHGRLPWGVLFANILASFVVGLAMQTEHWIEPILVVGICGGLSTFSSVAAASGEYFLAKQPVKAVGYAAASLVLPLLAVSAGAFTSPALLN